MGWLPKNETIKILVVCCMGLAPSVSNRQNFGRVRWSVPLSTKRSKLWLFPMGWPPKYETVKTLVARDGQAP